MTWVSCEGESVADKENLGAIIYYPVRGFPGYYFPYTGQEGYRSPLVAVLLEKPASKFLIPKTQYHYHLLERSFWDITNTIRRSYPIQLPSKFSLMAFLWWKLKLSRNETKSSGSSQLFQGTSQYKMIIAPCFVFIVQNAEHNDDVMFHRTI